MYAKNQENTICNEKNHSTETDADIVQMIELKNKDIKSYYDVFKKVGENMSILRHEKIFF